MVQKHCARCGQPFEAKRDSAKWCSSLCSNRNHRECNPAPKLPIEVRKCVQCGGEFKSRHWSKQACSKACKIAYNNGRKPTTQNEWRTCVVCERAFQPKQKRGVGRSYCSDTCRGKARYRHRKFGTSQKYYADYDVLFKKQDGKCAICGAPETIKDGRNGKCKKLALDHCHSSGKLRGLLCTGCNTGLGCFADDRHRLRAAITYLEKFT